LLHGRHVFLSAGIPNGDWPQPFDPLAITDAVIAATIALLAAGARILSGGHPAITPLLLRTARDFRRVADRLTDDEELVTVYQSGLYREYVPEPTWLLQAEGLGRLRFIPAVPGDDPVAGLDASSLSDMRKAMLGPSNDPLFAVFIGGMDGIYAEYELYLSKYKDRPVYAFGAPGGAARDLAGRLLEFKRSEFRRVNPADLLWSPNYGVIMDDVLLDAVERLSDQR